MRSQLRAVKPEPVSPSRNQGRGDEIDTRKRRDPSPLCGHGRLVRVKREPGTDKILRKPKKEVTPVTSPDAEDNMIFEAVMAPSLNDVVPVDLQMSMDAALAWSKAEWEREEAER
jgi:hypothetical protein